MRTTVWLVFVVLLVSNQPALPQQTWSLEDCIEYAMVHNLDIQKAGLKNERNEENYRQAIRNLLPGLSVGTGYGSSFGKSIDPITNDVIYNSFSSNSYSAGTSVTLFQGFRQINSIAFSKTLRLAGQYDQETLKATLSFQIMDAYFNAVFFHGLIGIAEETLASSLWNQTYVKGMIRNGLKAESDILEIEADVATEQLKKIKAQNDFDQAVLSLKQLINFEGDQPFEISDKIPDIPAEIRQNHTVDSLYFAALTRLPEIQSIRAGVQTSKIGLAQARSSFYPSLYFNAGVNTGFYQTRKGPDGQVISFPDQLSNNASEYLSFSLNIPIFNNGANRSQVKLARIQIKESELTLQQGEQRLYQKIHQDWKKLIALKMEIDQGLIQVEALKAAEKTLRKKLEKGLAGQFEYNQARNQLALARSGLLNTSLQYEIARKTIDYYQGLPIPGMH